MSVRCPEVGHSETGVNKLLLLFCHFPEPKMPWSQLYTVAGFPLD